MIEFLGQLGILFIILAFFGFVIKDAFQSGLSFKPPNFFKTYLQSLFHYVSIGLFFLSFILIIFILILASPNQDNFFTQSLNIIVELLQNFENNEILSKGFTKQLFDYFALSFVPALIYFFFISAVIIAGRISRLISDNWIKISFSDNTDDTFPKLIWEDDTFIYVSDKKIENNWIALRKNLVHKIESVKHQSQFQDKFQFFLSTLKRMWKDHQYLSLIGYLFDNFIILILLLIIIIPLLLSL